MIITTGKIVRIDAGFCQLQRSAETPGRVTVALTKSPGHDDVIDLPANEQEMERFIAAYRRICREHIEYRKAEVE